MSSGMPPPVRWFGSKARLAPQIVAMLPNHEHYVEVFAGSAAVLFAKPPSPLETINDLDGRIVNLFRVLRDPGMALRLAKAIALTPYARDEYVAAIGDPGEDPVEAARLFLVLSHQTIGNARSGTARGGWSFNVNGSAVSAARVKRWTALPDRLAACAARLRTVQVEALDWRVVLDRYDGHGVTMFIDPPYHHDTRPNTTDVYAHELGATEHTELVDRMIGLTGAQAVVTHYPHPLYDRLTEAGWSYLDLASHADNATARTQMPRTERVWVSPGAMRQMTIGAW